MTPSQGLRASARSRILGGHNIATPLNDGNAPGHAELCTTSPARIHIPSDLETNSSTRIANVRIRRSQHGALLLQSPARPGHATRMKHIFESASRDQLATQDDGASLYPQLPNVARKASPPLFHSRLFQQHVTCRSHNRWPESLCLPTNLTKAFSQPDQSQRNLSWRSEQTSGSWSDDSGYFIADSRGRESTPAHSAKDRIYDWLQHISLPNADLTDGIPASDSNKKYRSYCSKQVQIETRDGQLAPANDAEAELTNQRAQQSFEDGSLRELNRNMEIDPFVHDYRGSNRCLFFLSCEAQKQSVFSSFNHVRQENVFDRLKQPGVCRYRARPCDVECVQLASNEIPHVPAPHAQERGIVIRSPLGSRKLEHGGIDPSLSPNVCVERGPSRHHVRRKLSNINVTSPPHAHQPHTAQKLKENMSVLEGAL